MFVTFLLVIVRCDAKFLTCEISDYCRTAHAQTMRMNDSGGARHFPTEGLCSPTGGLCTFFQG